MADRFAQWEEVSQQLDVPRYYAYWRSYRMFQPQRVAELRDGRRGSTTVTAASRWPSSMSTSCRARSGRYPGRHEPITRPPSRRCWCFAVPAAYAGRGKVAAARGSTSEVRIGLLRQLRENRAVSGTSITADDRLCPGESRPRPPRPGAGRRRSSRCVENPIRARRYQDLCPAPIANPSAIPGDLRSAAVSGAGVPHRAPCGEFSAHIDRLKSGPVAVAGQRRGCRSPRPRSVSRSMVSEPPDRCTQQPGRKSESLDHGASRCMTGTKNRRLR